MPVHPHPKRRGGVDDLPPAPAVILCRPQMGENAGAAARAMLNFGLFDLRLVAPQFGWPNAKAVASSSGAHDILNRMTLHATLPDALHDVHHLLATTARPRGLAKPVFDPRAAALHARALVGQGRRVGLLFGPERTGLTNDELALADGIVSIPVNPLFPSLNLAQAVLLVAYEWATATGATAVQGADPSSAEPATKAEIDGMVGHLLGELEAVGYFRSDDRRASLSLTIKAMFERRGLARSEVHLLRGIVRELRRGPRPAPIQGSGT
ncbi:MAG: RNA methyltransferase [Geminicoccaceae bacterium]|nr:RNA methyltransferase [Geminicoccaceae bacterium]